MMDLAMEWLFQRSDSYKDLPKTQERTLHTKGELYKIWEERTLHTKGRLYKVHEKWKKWHPKAKEKVKQNPKNKEKEER